MESAMEGTLSDPRSLSGGSLTSCVSLTKAFHPLGLTVLIFQTTGLHQNRVFRHAVQEQFGYWSKCSYLDTDEHSRN